MKNFKLMPILLIIILASVTACTTPEADPSGTAADSDMNLGSEIVGFSWLWERFDDTAGLNNIVVDDPDLYTLRLNEDGTYEVKADCNLASGSYLLEDNSVTFEPGPTTLAECGPESLYNTYLTQLGDVVTFVMDGDKLVLNLWADGGNMVFTPAK